jgi:hypothetical protein
MAIRRLLLTPVLLLAGGCDNGSGPGTSDARIEAVGTTQFSAPPLSTVEGPLSARVTNAENQPLAGVRVTWSSDDGTVSPIIEQSDEDGLVFASWTLGWRPGPQEARATAVGVETPALFHATAEGFRAGGLSTGDGSHLCGIDPDGALFCWGANTYGELGNGTTTDSYAPARVLLSQSVIQVVTGSSGEFTCALTGSGEVYCWGDNSFGQLGNGTTSPSPSPVRVLLPGSFKSLSAIGPGVCAVAVEGDAYCWGSNSFGRFGNGTEETVTATPARVLGSLVWSQLALGDDRACGVGAGGQVYCWGRDLVELGTGVDTNTVAPLPVTNAPPMDSLTLSGWHQCGITPDNLTYCWGTNHNIGVADPRDVIPDPIALTTPSGFRSIHSVFNPTFALGLDGQGYWWGPPHDATGGGPETPEQFTGEIPLRALGTSAGGVCGIEDNTGTVFCWSIFGFDGPQPVTAVPLPEQTSLLDGD